MKLLTYKISGSNTHQIGVLKGNDILNLNSLFGNISLIDVIQINEYREKINNYFMEENAIKHNLNKVKFLPVIPKPTSFRDAYAFREHVETCRLNRGAQMIAEFDKFPVFYFSNHNSMYGNNQDIELMPDHFNQLDYELECAIVIGKRGKNILSSNADQYIAGFFILNDLSARGLQMSEMKLNLGPAKGKDFANSIGPYLVTTDELESKSIDTPCGKKYNMNMTCYVNGVLLSEGNVQNMKWTFAEIIERISYGVEIFPGDIIGSGTVGTGCLFEINGTKKRGNPDYVEQWLKNGDQIEMKIEGLGTLRNRIIKSNNNHSIIKKQK